MNVVSKLLEDVKLPPMAKVRQIFDDSKIEDVRDTLIKELSRQELSSTIKKDMRIAITCGSRGISNMPLTIKTIVEFCKEREAIPFIVPAMGSHGGATAEGQKAVCEALGVTEEYCGCPIISCMDTVKIGYTSCEEELFNNKAVFIDKNAKEADGIIVVNRIKPHTSFVGEHESGLMKMMTIGLGKQHGAEQLHEIGTRYMQKMVVIFGSVVLKKTNILFGVGLVENAYEETCDIAVLPKDEIIEKEPQYLLEAKRRMPRLLPGSADVLIVDQIGKNISGDGMDPHITGAFGPNFLACGGKPNFSCQNLVVLDLTKETEGQCMGIDAATFISKRCFDKIDFEKTYPNAITSCSPLAIPMLMENDKEAIQAACKTCVRIDRNNARIIRIKDTLHTSEILVSKPLLEEIRRREDIEVLEEPQEWIFDEKGNLW